MLEITTGELGHEAYISFDYARYTTEIPDDPNSTTAAESKKKTSASVGVIVGAVVGGVGLLCIEVFTSLLILRRKTRSPSRPHDTIPEPYPLNQPPEMNQIEEMRKPLRTRKRDNVNVGGFGEQMGQMQAQLNSLQTQSRVQPSEPPPSYNIFTSYEDPSLSEYANDIHQQPRIGR
ncbi:hypothetical protein E1B28_012693 [Marasmius oreades]|uniref:Uncharacterized protein n=1 Tax=Marasmius oreades TaxID=181124 RepID=A0A9P7RS70_9AGAR|nr:uncharacterized protein E1B28_012693 [Marasmius oreades]KAG7088725.1 hypothetical protein E1B28_012693 [Marasmius oreades]